MLLGPDSLLEIVLLDAFFNAHLLPPEHDHYW